MVNLRKVFTEVSVTILILLNLFDFFKLLPGDVDFFKKILSWTLMASLFYCVDFTWIFFGRKNNEDSRYLSHKLIDFIILLSYVFLSMKNVIEAARLGGEDAYYFKELINMIVTYSTSIEIWSFYIALTLMFLISLYIVVFLKVNKTSLIGNFGFSETNLFFKFIGVFGVILSFYLLVFDLIFEWLSTAVDSTIIMLGIGVYLILILRYHKHFGADSLVFKIGSFGENFEEHFLKFFHDKKHILLGLSGLLVLHLLTEISNYLFPYFLNLVSSMYFVKMNHQPLYDLFIRDTFLTKWTIGAYFFNVIAIFGFTIFPAILWYEVYKNKHNIIPSWLISLFLGSAIFFLIDPLFKFKSLENTEGMVGADIVSKSLIIKELKYILIACILLTILIYILSYNSWFSKFFYHITILSVLSFFGYYLYLFYLSTGKYFIENIRISLQFQSWFFVIALSVFFVIKILFPIVSFIAYVIQLNKKHLF